MIHLTDKGEFPVFPPGCRSLLCRHLTPVIFDQLKGRSTANGYSFKQLINSGAVNPDSAIGVYAGDAASYVTFAALLDPIIEEYHGFTKYQQHSSNFSIDDLIAPNPDPTGEYIISTRIRVARNLANYPFGALINDRQRKEVEHQVATVLNELPGKLSGQYFSLQTLSEAQRSQLVADHFLFKAGDRFLNAAGLNRDWPQGRGIYHNDEKTFLVWINEEDQLRIISMQSGGDIEHVFARLCGALGELERRLQFSYNPHLGYLTSCPTNLGTAMRCSVHIKLPVLASDMPSLERIADRYYLQIRGIHGEHSDSESGVFDISNRRRLGTTEVDCVQALYDGILALIDAEKKL